MTLDDLIELAKTPNVAAFLRTIREAESSQDDDAYRTLFGGGKFTGFASHPNQAVERMLGGKVVRSTAAGAYQFLSGTWREIAGAYAITDFSPASQDAGAVALIRRASSLDDVIAGRFEVAIGKCASTWAGLPGDKYGQGGISMERARAAYTRWGGTFDAAPTTAAPIVESQPAYIAPEAKPVAPILAALFPSIIAAIPELAKVFGSGSAVSERNAKAAEVVAQVVQQATGAVNVQQAVERVTSDPAARQAAAEAVQANWFQIAETGGGVQAARQFSADVMASDRPMWRLPAFIVTCLLLPLVYFVVAYVLMADGFSPDLKAMVVAAIVTGVLSGGIQSMWFGTSWGSQKKDDYLRR